MNNFIFKIKDFICQFTGKYDFWHKCMFDYQLRNYKGFKNGNGEIIEVKFKSGRIGLYKVYQNDQMWYNGTGQHDWYFKFLRFKETK